MPWSAHDSNVIGACMLAAAPLIAVYLRSCCARGFLQLGRSRVEKAERPALFGLLLWSYSAAVGGLAVLGLLAVIQ